MAPLQHNVTLMYAIYQVAGDEELLDTARDCFRFVTTFFEPINVSAVHIYHSALELSPLSSIVRRLYYHRRHTPFPRVVTGTQGSWGQSSTTHFGGDFDRSRSFAWSPCGQFVTTNYRGAVVIRDPLISEPLATLRLIKPISQPFFGLAYSPDGRSLAALSDTSLVIWDIQTGGVTKEIILDVQAGERVIISEPPLVWSLNGRAITICTALGGGTPVLTCSACVCDVDSGVAHFYGPRLLSFMVPHIWAHNESFRIMTRGWDWQTGCTTINISEVGSVLTKIESFCVGPPCDPLRAGSAHMRIESFSPTTYRIATSVDRQLRIFDIRNWGCLSAIPEERGYTSSNCFSSDGSLFATTLRSEGCVQIWKYGSRYYTVWGKFSTQRIDAIPKLRFSPTLSSIAGFFPDLLQVWRLDRPFDAYPDGPGCAELGALSHCGTYVATSHYGGSAVAITDLLSQSPSQFIETGVDRIVELALTGNVLLVRGDCGLVTAWRLTEEGVVDGPSRERSAGPGDSIWTILSPRDPTLVIRDRTVVIWNRPVTHTYCVGTGEVLEPAQPPPLPHDHQYSLRDLMHGLHYPHCRGLEVPSTRSESDWPVSRTTLEEEGWVKGPEGRHRLWIPPAWRLRSVHAGWHCNITTLCFTPKTGSVIVKF